MLKPLQFSLIIAFIFFASSTFGQVKFSNDFLAIGVGARAQGMGNAQTSVTNDLTSGYWNPAGLTSIQSPLQVGAMHAEWFGSVANYDFISIAKPLNQDKKSVVGLTVIRLGIDNIPNTINLVDKDGTINYDNITEFSAADYAVLLSYAREIKLKDRTLSIGGNTKIIRRVIGSFAGAWGFGLDFGLQYKVKDKWHFGLMARDITSTFNAWNFTFTEAEKEVFVFTGNDIPESSVEITRPRILLGSAYKARFNEKLSLTTSLDLDFTTDGQRNVLVSSENFNMDPRLGLELDYKGFIYIRGGVSNFQQVLDDVDGTKKLWDFQPHFGIGIVLGRFTIDYAQANIGNVGVLQASNLFSLKIDFKEKKKKGF
ncbi:MAG: PorV/PorQ family protein [Saprospiraceae bacterium]